MLIEELGWEVSGGDENEILVEQERRGVSEGGETGVQVEEATMDTK